MSFAFADPLSVPSRDGAAFLRAVYPAKTAANVEAFEGVSGETFRKWESGVSSPNFATTLALIARHGPEFLAAVLPQAPAWLTSSVREQRQRALEASLEHLQSELAQIQTR